MVKCFGTKLSILVSVFYWKLWYILVHAAADDSLFFKYTLLWNVDKAAQKTRNASKCFSVDTSKKLYWESEDVPPTNYEPDLRNTAPRLEESGRRTWVDFTTHTRIHTQTLHPQHLLWCGVCGFLSVQEVKKRNTHNRLQINKRTGNSVMYAPFVTKKQEEEEEREVVVGMWVSKEMKSCVAT